MTILDRPAPDANATRPVVNTPRRSGPLARPDGGIDRTGSGPLADMPPLTPPVRCVFTPSPTEIPTRPAYASGPAFDEAKRRLGDRAQHRFELISVFPAPDGHLDSLSIHARRDGACTRAYVARGERTWAMQHADAAEVVRALWRCVTGNWPGITAGYWQFTEYPRWDNPRWEDAWAARLATLQARAATQATK